MRDPFTLVKREVMTNSARAICDAYSEDYLAFAARQYAEGGGPGVRSGLLLTRVPPDCTLRSGELVALPSLSCSSRPLPSPRDQRTCRVRVHSWRGLWRLRAQGKQCRIRASNHPSRGLPWCIWRKGGSHSPLELEVHHRSRACQTDDHRFIHGPALKMW